MRDSYDKKEQEMLAKNILDAKKTAAEIREKILLIEKEQKEKNELLKKIKKIETEKQNLLSQVNDATKQNTQTSPEINAEIKKKDEIINKLTSQIAQKKQISTIIQQNVNEKKDNILSKGLETAKFVAQKIFNMPDTLQKLNESIGGLTSKAIDAGLFVSYASGYLGYPALLSLLYKKLSDKDIVSAKKIFQFMFNYFGNEIMMHQRRRFFEERKGQYLEAQNIYGAYSQGSEDANATPEEVAERDVVNQELEQIADGPVDNSDDQVERVQQMVLRSGNAYYK